MLALAGVLVWKFWPMDSAPANGSSAKTAPSPTAAVLKPVPGQVVEAPKAAPAPAANAPKQPDDSKPADLNFAISHLIDLLEAKDYAAAVKEFTPPDELNLVPGYTFDGMTHFLETNPYAPERVTAIIEVLRSIQGQTPVMDQQGDPILDDTLKTTLGYTGEKAIYRPNPPSSTPDGEKIRVVFVKENGVWYLRGFLPPFLANGMLTGPP